MDAKQAAAVHAAAALRNYHVRPRLGNHIAFWSDSIIIDISLLLDYRTVSAVNGPLVILDNVKVYFLILFRLINSKLWFTTPAP